MAISNDPVILAEVLTQTKADVAPGLDPSEYFEFFSAEQILKDYDLSYDEIESGQFGGQYDGGVDSMYVFVNGELVQEDPDYSNLKKNVDLEVILVQAKSGGGFAETPIERFITASDDIFDLHKSVEDFRSVYNDAFVETIDRFRKTYKQLAARFPSLRITFCYTSKGAIRPGTNVTRKAEKLKEAVLSRFPSAIVDVEFLGASELLALARRAPKTTYSLTMAEQPISSEGEVGFVCLVRLRDFYDFITDDEEKVIRHIFEANVRDYQGPTQVNDEIQESLKQKDSEDFWWLNNGITIVASRASQSAKTLTIEDPQIVNGLQTSTEIHKYFSQYKTEGDQRNVLVRVIVPSHADSRDRIIKATNSQTAVPPASLRATGKIHRDIEEYLYPRGLYYDRRKNFYKNEGKPRDRIIGIPQLAQATMAIVLARPDNARARPSSLLKRDDDYEQVYNLTYPIALYHLTAETIKRVEAYLRSGAAGLESKDRNNLRFYVAMYVVYRLSGKWRPSAAEIAGLDPEQVTDDRIRDALEAVKTLYEKLGGTDRVAKGTELLKEVRQLISKSGA